MVWESHPLRICWPLIYFVAGVVFGPLAVGTLNRVHAIAELLS